jgi:Domain of Unknown Function with PDB structure (DUF3857)
MKPRSRVLASALVALVCLAAAADTLYLRDGEQQAGQLVKMKKSKLWFEGREGVSVYDKAEVHKVQLQRARHFDDIETAGQITDPDLLAAMASQPSEQDYPAAGYVVLLERRTFDLSKEGTVLDTTRLIAKVLRQRGEDVATQSAWYYEDTDIPRIDYALTVTPDGRVLHLDDAALKNESIYANLPTYRRLARFRFACKEPRPGSILDIQYTVERKRGGPLEPFYTRELFRGDQPILRKEVIARIPAERRLSAQEFGPEAITPDHALENGMTVLTCVLDEPQPGIVPEPFMPPTSTIAPSVTLGEGATWDTLVAAYVDVLNGLPPLPDDLAAKAKQRAADAGEDGAVAAIHSFVARGIRTARVSHLEYGLTPHAPGETAQRGLANELDKNVLYYRMLRAAGIDCAFSFVRSRDRGPLADKVPSLRAFDRSAVRLASGAYSTTVSDVLSWGTLPGSMQGADALLIEPGQETTTKTPCPAPETELEATEFDGTLAPDGRLELAVTYAATGNAAQWFRQMKDMDDQQLRNQLQQIAGAIHPAAVLTNLEQTDLADLSEDPRITLHCDIPAYATTAGDDLMLFTLPALFYDAQAVGRPSREHPLHWNNVAMEKASGVIRLPEGFTVYSLPDPVDFESDTVSYQASLEAADGTLTFSDRYTLKTPDAPKEAYGVYKTCVELRARLPRQRIILARQ